MIQYPIIPWIMLEELNKFKLLYGNPPIFIHENGLSLPLSKITYNCNEYFVAKSTLDVIRLNIKFCFNLLIPA